MPHVEIEVNGRLYPVACQHGEQERIIQLGRYIDRRFRDLAEAGGTGTDLHMVV
ncbi:cell division protein ZapA, partial [bacterium]|nr:cell division protein ZapA [bacterium]